MTEPKKPGQQRRQYRTVAAKHAHEVLDRVAGPCQREAAQSRGREAQARVR